MKIKIYLPALLILAFAATRPAGAQKEVSLLIRDGQPAIAFALPPFAASGPAAALAEEIHDVLEADLKYSRIFQVLPKSYYAYIRALDPRSVVYKDWESIGAAVLFTGEVSMASGGDIVLERNFYDVKSQKTIIPGKRYQAKKTDLRYLAHKTAEIMEG